MRETQHFTPPHHSIINSLNITTTRWECLTIRGCDWWAILLVFHIIVSSSVLGQMVCVSRPIIIHFSLWSGTLCWMVMPLKTLACTSLLQVPSTCMSDCFNQTSISQVTERAGMHVKAVCLHWPFSECSSQQQQKGHLRIFFGLSLFLVLSDAVLCPGRNGASKKREFLLCSAVLNTGL